LAGRLRRGPPHPGPASTEVPRFHKPPRRTRPFADAPGPGDPQAPDAAFAGSQPRLRHGPARQGSEKADKSSDPPKPARPSYFDTVLPAGGFLSQALGRSNALRWQIRIGVQALESRSCSIDRLPAKATRSPLTCQNNHTLTCLPRRSSIDAAAVENGRFSPLSPGPQRAASLWRIVAPVVPSASSPALAPQRLFSASSKSTSQRKPEDCESNPKAERTFR